MSVYLFGKALVENGEPRCSSLARIIGPNDGELSVMQSDVEGHSGLLQIELLPAAHKL